MGFNSAFKGSINKGSCDYYMEHNGRYSTGKAVPLQAWSGPEGSGKLRIPFFMTTAQDGGKFVSLTHQPPLPPGNAPSTHFCKRRSWAQGHSAIGRIPVTPSGIEPATFRFVAQHLDHCATAVAEGLLVITKLQPQLSHRKWKERIRAIKQTKGKNCTRPSSDLPSSQGISRGWGIETTKKTRQIEVTENSLFWRDNVYSFVLMGVHHSSTWRRRGTSSSRVWRNRRLLP